MMKSVRRMMICTLCMLATSPTFAEDFYWDFENGMEGWTVIDANHDGYTWTLTSAVPTTWPSYSGLSLDWYHTGKDAICSGSYINGVGALIPDEYLVSPQFTPVAGSTISFWAAATDATYAADHFGVAVSRTTATPEAFSILREWNMTSSRNFTGGRQLAPRRVGSWHKYTVDLSGYAGQKIYVAIRHFNCVDQYIMVVDNIEITQVQQGDDSGKTVGIADVSMSSNVDGRLYDLQGRLLHVHPGARGIYISGGKKIVMRK